MPLHYLVIITVFLALLMSKLEDLWPCGGERSRQELFIMLA